MSFQLSMHDRLWPMREPFQISRQTITHQPGFVVTLVDANGIRAHGEACGVDYAGETIGSMRAQIEALRPEIEAGLTRTQVLDLLPPGGARFALDSALWDMESKRHPGGIAGILGHSLKPVTTAFTIGMRSLPDYMETARRYADFPILKVKVDTHDPIAALSQVRAGAPHSGLIVDPNQAWSVSQMKSFAPILVDLGVILLEQPIPVGAETDLDGWQSPIPLAADELINDQSDLDLAVGRFDVVNIKLDKCGGLTAALALADAIEAKGMKLMVGCMAGSSLAMAPAMVLAQISAFVDLDGPLLQSEDWPQPLECVNGILSPPHPELWG